MRGAPRVPVIIILVFVASAIFADFLALHDPEMGNSRQRLIPPAWVHGGMVKYPLGTDNMGRDVLSRLIYGARISLLVSFAAVIISGLFGTTAGLVSGFFGGWVDQIIMRCTDACLSIPTVMFGILMAVIAGPSVINVIIIMILVHWTRYARVTRGETLSLKARDYIHLATIAGSGKFRIIRKHILPNVMNMVITVATMQLGIVIVAEASLTFLGVGVPPPKPAWGLMLSEGRGGILGGCWWLVIFPGLAIALPVLSANLIGDWLRIRLDPHFGGIKE